MILDERAEFADATAANTGAAASYLVGDVIDLGAADQMGDVDDLILVIQVDTAFTSGGSNTTQFHLASDAQAAIAVDGTATYHWSSPAIAVASLIAGYYIARVPMPKSTSYEQYLGILQTTAVAALTAGKINAFLVPAAVFNKYFANAPGAKISL